MRRIVWQRATGAVLLAALSSEARGQWQVVYLHPEGAESSDVYAAAGVLQGGSIELWNNEHPVIWNRSPDDYVDLLPQGWRTGIVNGMDGPWQVGYVASQFNQAAMWAGSAESMVILTPGGVYPAAVALDVIGEQQVGYAAHTGEGQVHAALWFGSAESFVDLHPTVARWSEALATDGARQGGRVDRIEPGVGIHAALWQGSPESFIDMNPEDARESRITSMAGDLQVGDALFDTAWHAIIWRGTPDSYESLQPPGASNSSLFDTTGTIHVGGAFFDGALLAGVWMSDDPASFVSLQPYLDPGWSRSIAKAVAVHNGYLYVAGDALPPNGPGQAVLWMRPIAQPFGSPTEVQPRRILPRP